LVLIFFLKKKEFIIEEKPFHSNNLKIYQLLVTTLDGKTLCLAFEKELSVYQLKQKLQNVCGIPVTQQRVCNLYKEFSDSHLLSESCTLSLGLRILGGKGGFGALLRGAGAKAGAKMITNFDDCRDLTGKRIRHIKNEKKLVEWSSTEKG